MWRKVHFLSPDLGLLRLGFHGGLCGGTLLQWWFVCGNGGFEVGAGTRGSGRAASAAAQWCSGGVEAAAMVVREEEELAVAVNLKLDSRLVQVRWNATVTGGAVVTELWRADGGCRGCWCVNLLPSRLVHGGEKMVLQNRGGQKRRRLPWRLIVAAMV
ncbi:hypothetical protein DEO72_LG7g1320 [Vigna unguiculata]|uniref:Uncharacterized protein n=1 Tax=Vigna unguiculata TaxID=3917 RepID=A0A4D6MGW8_VIGUN|nr:hypothetical protein DEO72_LG7g1320 [Vigna unguiculata]